MIDKLKKGNFKVVKPLLPGLTNHPVINGVIDGNNPGEIFVDNQNYPETAFFWAKNEMFYLCGKVDNQEFNSKLEEYIASVIRFEALPEEDTLNLEIYPNHQWNGSIESIFTRVPLLKGERVPFVFHKEWFTPNDTQVIPEGYKLKVINKDLIDWDESHIVKNEITKFWGESLDSFFQKGLGCAVVRGSTIIGTCLSVFVSNNEYEIGINTYDPSHRGKGLATAMASAFIKECLSRGGNPHWTTESFRKDSIAIAKKVGFEQLDHYPVYYLLFDQFVIK
ncbi:GNAT family N-acetyltransferase [Fredinandcohnia sp. QZ13]|uniref:GNAT family N-acetyltransferase n=1 Tax=Fredinandcohnia sp. QZ13 TaxID=3073144 RepID=UPI0028530A45|nr:GNAT family N-acetyltransferase [Fredinandcohnia sp. QZ13]MDR4890348.1 GNAT family N-acetyltransferase [Fredinandcohnia sp. QZ13]